MKDSVKSDLLMFLRHICNDKMYYKIRYYIKFKKRLSLKNPDTFNAKINWLKLYDRNPLYSRLVDKYEVRSFVERKIGDEYLNTMYGVYNSTSQINFDKLPDSFVLKGTHGSSWVIVCPDKSQLNIQEAKNTMDVWLKKNFYKLYGEWVYKNVPPRIICEKYLSNQNESALIDYKFYCFNGAPKFIHVDTDRFEKHCRNFYDLNWQRMPFSLCYPQADRDVKRPSKLAKMIELASILSADFKFVRVDFYQVDDKIVFGELTFNPGNGLEIFTPNKYDLIFGQYININ